MDLATFTRESTLNRQAYEQLREPIQREYLGQYVAMAHGQLVGAARTFDEACALVQRLEPVPEYYLVFPASEEPDFDLVYDLTEGGKQILNPPFHPPAYYLTPIPTMLSGSH